MPITPIPDLNTDRKIATEFSVTLARRADGTIAVLITCAAQAGNDQVIANYSGEDIYNQLTQTQKNIAASFITSAETKVKALLGL